MNWLPPILFVFAIAISAVAGLLLVRRRVHHAALSKHNDVAGVMFSIVGTLYAVLLAFVVIVVWEAMGTADDRAALEAGILGDVVRDAGFFADPLRSELQNELREYTQAVIDEEWPAMATSESSPHVWDTLNRIFESFSHLNPATPREINIHAEMLRRLNDLSDHRRLRLLSADNKVPPLMWVVLIIGGLITLGFSYLFGVERGKSHALMTAALAGMIGLTLYLILAMDHPFGGTIRVEPDAFRLVLEKVGPVNYSR
jgi:protein-S-isoprenylcysteine O-methyltransferase Ste14